MKIVDRYDILGIPHPDIDTMCKGQCEGLGYVPIYKNETRESWKALWEKAEKRKPSSDGWHFVICPDCGGTGKRKTCRLNRKRKL